MFSRITLLLFFLYPPHKSQSFFYYRPFSLSSFHSVEDKTTRLHSRRYSFYRVRLFTHRKERSTVYEGKENCLCSLPYGIQSIKTRVGTKSFVFANCTGKWRLPNLTSGGGLTKDAGGDRVTSEGISLFTPSEKRPGGRRSERSQLR